MAAIAVVREIYEERSVEVATIIMFAALTAVGARAYIPFLPVPFTMQVYFVILSGVVLGPNKGAMSMVAYILMGVAGVPVFASFPHAGPAVLIGPTGGYIIAFPLASYLAGKAVRHGNLSMVRMTIGMLLIYFLGVMRLSIGALSVEEAIRVGLFPFMIPDIIKLLAVKFTYGGLRRHSIVK